MKVKKAYEITDAKIQFVSLVDKAANLKSFLITKAKDGRASFSTYGRLVAKDAERHFVTGVVYEPMAEDAHGNFMTEDEITKAAYYFAKAGGKIDLQHNFEPLPGAEVVESWVAKADFTVGDETVKKGTWLMTVELSDGDLWAAIEKGEITGFSMGGVGNYSEEDVKLETMEKSAERKGIFKKLAEAFGFEVVEKDELADEPEQPEPVKKAGKKMSGKNRETLQGICDQLTTFLAAFDEPEEKPGEELPKGDESKVPKIEPSKDGETNDEDKEDKDVKKSEVEKLVQETVAASVAKALGEQAPAASEEVTAEAVQKMVEDAVAKALAPAGQEETVTAESVAKMVEEAVAKAVEPVLKARGVPSALNDGAPVEKQVEQHYLHGII